MTQEDKKLLLKDLCERIPYGVKATTKLEGWNETYVVTGCIYNRIYLDCPVYDDGDDEWMVESVVPYLRPILSITENELANLCELLLNGEKTTVNNIEIYCNEIHCLVNSKIDGLEGREFTSFNYEIDLTKFSLIMIDWLNAHHFDYRGLIEKGLALEAPKNMYNI